MGWEELPGMVRKSGPRSPGFGMGWGWAYEWYAGMDGAAYGPGGRDQANRNSEQLGLWQ